MRDAFSCFSRNTSDAKVRYPTQQLRVQYYLNAISPQINNIQLVLSSDLHCEIMNKQIKSL